MEVKDKPVVRLAPKMVNQMEARMIPKSSTAALAIMQAYQDDEVIPSALRNRRKSAKMLKKSTAMPTLNKAEEVDAVRVKLIIDKRIAGMLEEMAVDYELSKEEILRLSIEAFLSK